MVRGQSNPNGILAMVAAMGAFVTSDSLLKFVFASMPMFESMFMRGLVGTTLCIFGAIAMGHAKDLRQAFNPFVVGRGLMEMAANTIFLLALYFLPVAEVVAVVQTTPLLVLAGAALFYGEKLNGTRILLILMGLTGALLVAQPGSSATSPYMVLCFAIAFLVAARDLLTRRVPETVPAPVATSSVMAILTLAAAVGMLVSKQTMIAPTIPNLGVIVFSGILFAAGQLLVFLAYKIGEARAVAPFMYTLTVWAIALGYLLFGDVPNTLALCGMGLIVASGLLVIFTDRGKA